jgi:hypothetical protein
MGKAIRRVINRALWMPSRWPWRGPDHRLVPRRKAIIHRYLSHFTRKHSTLPHGLDLSRSLVEILVLLLSGGAPHGCTQLLRTDWGAGRSVAQVAPAAGGGVRSTRAMQLEAVPLICGYTGCPYGSGVITTASLPGTAS